MREKNRNEILTLNEGKMSKRKDGEEKSLVKKKKERKKSK